MIDISEYLNKIASSRFGVDVRDSIHDSLEAMQDAINDGNVIFVDEDLSMSGEAADAKKTGDIFDDTFEILKNIGFSVKSSSTKSYSFNFKFYIGDTIVIKNLGVQCNIIGYKTTDGSSVVLASNMFTKNIIVYTFSDNIKAIEINPLNSDKDINVSFSLSKTTENIWSFCKGLNNYNTDKYVYGNVGVGDQYSFTTNDENTVSVFYLTSGTSVQINKGYKFIVWAFKKDNPSSTFFLHTNGNIDQTRVYTDDVIYLNNEDYFYGISVKRNDLSEITVEDAKNNLIILDNKKHEYLIGRSYDYGNPSAKISMQLNDNQMFGVSIKPLDDNINMIHLSHGYVAKLIFVENTDKSTAFSVPEDFQQNIYVTEYRKEYENHSVFLMIKREDGQIMDNNFVVDMYDNKNLNNKTVSEIVIAASNSDDYDKYNSDFICSGTNDEIIINRAINALNGSGTIYFCDGDYYIDNYYYTKTSGEYTAAFSIGITQNLEQKYIGFEGKNPPSLKYGGQEPCNTAILHISEQCLNKGDAFTSYNVIGYVGILGGDRLFTKYSLGVKNLGFILESNQHACKVINASLFSQFWLSDCRIMIKTTGDADNPESLQVANDKCVAVKGLEGSNMGVGYRIKNTFVYGFGVGFDINGEHLIMEQCGVRYSKIPYRFGNNRLVGVNSHDNTLINCCDESCIESIVFDNNDNRKQAINFYDYNMEIAKNGRFAKTKKAIETVPGTYRGFISYSAAYIDGAGENVFVPFFEDNNGLNFEVTNKTILKRGTYSDRPTEANPFERYYATDTRKEYLYHDGKWNEI